MMDNKTLTPQLEDGRFALPVAIAVHALLIDSAIETFLAGSHVRWLVLGVTGLYAIVLIGWWRLRREPGQRLTDAALARAGAATLLLIAAGTAWAAAGTTDGLRALGLSTSRLLSLIAIGAVALASLVLSNELRTRPAARWGVLAVSTYCVVALFIGLARGTSYAAQMHGASFWSRLPFWLQGGFVGSVVLVPLAILVLARSVVKNLRQDQSPRIVAQKAAALLMMLSTVLAALVAPGGVAIDIAAVAQSTGLTSAGTPPERFQGPERLAQVLRAVESAKKQIPRDTFDPNVIVQSVGSDATNLFAWVRDNTYWVPYRGALRGPIGVLMDRLGNSLDRSLLLAELLRTAGHTIRLAHTTLSDQRAREWRDQIRLMPSIAGPKGSEAPVDQVDPAIDSWASDAGLDPSSVRGVLRSLTQRSDQLAAELKRRVGVQAPFLAASVTPQASGRDDADKSITALKDHWWVQRQNGTEWVDLDPLLPGTRAASVDVQADQTFAFDKPSGTIPLPSEYAHEISIKVIVEQWSAGRLTEKTALTHTFRPAEVIGQSIVLQHIPLGPVDLSQMKQVKDPLGTLKSMITKQTEWLPELAVGERAVRQSSFTDTGALKNKPEAGGSSAAAAAGGILDAFGGGGESGDPDSNGQLTAEWVEYTIAVPGESPKTVRRDVFDLLNHRQRSSGESVGDFSPSTDQRERRAMSVVSTIQILPVVCRLSPQYVAMQTLTEILANANAMQGLARSVATRDLEALVAEAKRVKPTTDQLLNLGLARFEWSQSAQDVYLDAPNILSYRTALSSESATKVPVLQGFDIVANAVAVRSGSRGGPFQTRLAQGAADTNAEALLAGVGKAVNAATMMGGDSIRRDDWVVIRRTDDQALSAGNWPTDIRARMQQAVSNGYVVVAPRATASQDGRTAWAWWQVDPRTGSTLGIGDQGWGQAGVERSLLDVLLAAQLAFQLFFMWAFFYCVARDSATSEYPMGVISVDNFGKCLCAGLAAGAAAGAFVAAPAVGVGLAMVAAAVYKEAVCA
jgi:hypothetical protein